MMRIPILIYDEMQCDRTVTFLVERMMMNRVHGESHINFVIIGMLSIHGDLFLLWKDHCKGSL